MGRNKHEAAEMKPEPQSASRSINQHRRRVILVSHIGPANMSHFTRPWKQEEAEQFIGEQESSFAILTDGERISTGNTCDGGEPVVVDVTDNGGRGYPDA